MYIQFDICMRLLGVLFTSEISICLLRRCACRTRSATLNNANQVFCRIRGLRLALLKNKMFSSLARSEFNLRFRACSINASLEIRFCRWKEIDSSVSRHYLVKENGKLYNLEFIKNSTSAYLWLVEDKIFTFTTL